MAKEKDDKLYTLTITFAYDIKNQEDRVDKFNEFKDGKLSYYNMDYKQINLTQKAITRFSDNLTALADEE
jgi:hypothetical protein